VRDLGSDRLPAALKNRQMELLRKMNIEHRKRVAADREIDALIQSFEVAFRMQTEASEVFDVDKEPKNIREDYGLDRPETENFGRQCLTARRLAEAGVRFTLITHSVRKIHATVREWDQHSNLERDHRRNALEIDQPISALLTDLKARGLLEDTLVIWSGEFGRAPMIELKKDKPNQITAISGRNHNPVGFTMWMAGGGVKPGFSFGGTDEIGYRAVEGRVHTSDLHATILHLLGMDHEKLSYRHSGLDVRLTGVERHRVVHEIIA